MRIGRIALIPGFILALSAARLAAQVNVTTYHNDNLRTGVNSRETILRPSNVNTTRFGKLFDLTVDGQVYAQPLYMSGVSIPGRGVRNVVYVATEHDSVYAFDADTKGAAPLWHASFLSGTTVTSVPWNDVNSTDIWPEIGITATPVIDGSSGTIYIEAKTLEQGVNYVQKLHALDITTGFEKLGGPVTIAASAVGTGTGSVSGVIAFNSRRQLCRAALLLVGSNVVMAWASHGDYPPYHGWVISYSKATLQQTGVFNTTPNGSEGGIWQGGAGLAADQSGYVYFSSGNGTFITSLLTGNHIGLDYGDSIIKLHPGSQGGLYLADYFTPYNQAALSATDADLGSGGVLLLPVQSGTIPNIAVAAGKEGCMYLLNLQNLGKYDPAANRCLQNIAGACYGQFGMPAYFNGRIYISGLKDHLRAYRFAHASVATPADSISPTAFTLFGCTPAVSASGTSNGIVWATERTDPGTLHAYDAGNLAIELYNTNQALLGRDLPGPGAGLGTGIKFSVPTVADGKVYMGCSDRVSVYGLLP